jgi:hypothetical protein
LRAKGLVNTLSYGERQADRADQDTLLARLRELFQSCPDDAAVCQQLAMALFSILADARDADRVLADALLDELRALARTHPDDTAVRQWLAIGMANTLCYSGMRGDRARRDALIEQLRVLFLSYPHDTNVREQLAMCLLGVLNFEREKGNRALDGPLLEGLWALFQKSDQASQDALIDQLRGLARTRPNDISVRHLLSDAQRRAQAERGAHLGRRAKRRRR